MLFNYNTLNVNLIPKTKTLTITLNRPKDNNTINIEMLFELEGLLGWLTSHLEINSVLIESSNPQFLEGFDEKELQLMSEEKIKKYILRYQKIIKGLMTLPQTIVCDIGMGAKGMGIELFLGADIKIAHENAELNFDNLNNGWIFAAGGNSLLGDLIGQGLARQWILSSSTVKGSELYRSNIIFKFYNETKKVCEEILTSISKQAPVARIQTKRVFIENVLESSEKALNNDAFFSFNYLPLQEWKIKDSNYLSAKEFSSLLKSKRSEKTIN